MSFHPGVIRLSEHCCAWIYDTPGFESRDCQNAWPACSPHFLSVDSNPIKFSFHDKTMHFGLPAQRCADCFDLTKPFFPCTIRKIRTVPKRFAVKKYLRMGHGLGQVHHVADLFVQ